MLLTQNVSFDITGHMETIDDPLLRWMQSKST